MKQVNIRKICLLLCVAAVVLLTGCGAGEPEKKSDSDGIRIGFSFDSLVIERRNSVLLSMCRMPVEMWRHRKSRFRILSNRKWM